MNESARAKLEAWLEYCADLGLVAIYRDRAAAPIPATAACAEAAPSAPRKEPSPMARPKKPAVEAPVAVAPSLFEVLERVEGDMLERIVADMGDCTRCKLHQGRTHIVFGDGNPRAELIFVGEGPGHDEDVQGLPFVGRAGRLLNEMIENGMGLRRQDVYICNIVMCRPPENRIPERDEIATCSPFLLRQLAVIQPKVIVCLGSVAAQTLLSTNKGISHYRGQWFDFRGSRLIATYHPAYLLRNPDAKRDVWNDLKKVMAVLGLKPPKKRPA